MTSLAGGGRKHPFPLSPSPFRKGGGEIAANCGRGRKGGGRPRMEGKGRRRPKRSWRYIPGEKEEEEEMQNSDIKKVREIASEQNLLLLEISLQL